MRVKVVDRETEELEWEGGVNGVVHEEIGPIPFMGVTEKDHWLFLGTQEDCPLREITEFAEKQTPGDLYGQRVHIAPYKHFKVFCR